MKINSYLAALLISALFHALGLLISFERLYNPAKYSLVNVSVVSEVELVASPGSDTKQTENEAQEAIDDLATQHLSENKNTQDLFSKKKAPTLRKLATKQKSSFANEKNQIATREQVQQQETEQSGARNDAKPNYLRNPPPKYPDYARRNKIEGRVELIVTVSPEGKATKVELLKSSGFTSLDDAAKRAVEKWQFSPATIAGVPTASDIVIPIKFELNAK